MAFNNTKIVGNGTAQTVVTNGANTESVVNSLVAYNTTDGVLAFDMLINDTVVVTEDVSANGSFRLPDKLNIQVDTELKVNAPTGITVTVSYLNQAIDVSAATTLVQDKATQADASANSAATSEANAASSEAHAQSMIDTVFNPPEWVSGTDYDKYAVVVSPTDFINYRAKENLTNNTYDPSTDTTGWMKIALNDVGIAKNTAVTGTQTLDRHDKQLGNRDVVEMVYTDKLDTVRYTDDDASTTTYYRDQMTYDTDGKLVKVEHFNNTADLDTPSGTTALTYDANDKLISTSYTE